MEILVTDKSNEKIRAKTDFGSFWCRWCSQEDATISQKYYVELDFDGIITHDDIVFANNNYPSIHQEGDMTHVTGYVEEINNGVLFLRLDFLLIMVEIYSSFDFSKYLGKYITITRNDVTLYDYEV